MSTESIRAAIAATVNGIVGIGQFHDREKYAKDLKAVREFYEVTGKLKGGFVTRARFNRVSPAAGHTVVVTTSWEIHYFLSFVDSADSQDDFDALLDLMTEAFDANSTLSDTVDTTITQDQAGLALISSQPAMFAGVLVHYARLSLQTEHSE